MAVRCDITSLADARAMVAAVVMSWVMMGPLDKYLTEREIEEVLAANLDEQED